MGVLTLKRGAATLCSDAASRRLFLWKTVGCGVSLLVSAPPAWAFFVQRTQVVLVFAMDAGPSDAPPDNHIMA